VTPLLLLPATVFGFLGGASLGVSRRGLSMLKPSPLPGVPMVRWARLVAVVARRPRDYSQRGRWGCFGLDARRLADVGFMTSARKAVVDGAAGTWAGEWVPPMTSEKFLASVPAQHEAFARSMRKMAAAAAPHVGRMVDGERASLSGLLAAGHLAGEEGLAGWVTDPRVRQKFGNTTKLFKEANSIF